MRFLPTTRRALAALVEAMAADEDENGLAPPPQAMVWRVVDEYDAWLASCTPTMPIAMSLVVGVFEWLPIVIVHRLSRMSSLPLAERIEYLEKCERGSVGLLVAGFMGLKVGLTMLIYEKGSDLHETGYDRPTLASRRRLPVSSGAR